MPRRAAPGHHWSGWVGMGWQQVAKPSKDNLVTNMSDDPHTYVRGPSPNFFFVIFLIKKLKNVHFQNKKAPLKMEITYMRKHMKQILTRRFFKKCTGSAHVLKSNPGETQEI